MNSWRLVHSRGPYGTYRRVAGPLPKHRVKTGPAPELGADTEGVLRQAGIGTDAGSGTTTRP